MKISNIILCALIGIIIMLLVYDFCAQHEIRKIDVVADRITNAEKTLATLHTCFPGGHYQADAAPSCPAFKEWLTGELNKNEPTFKEGK